VTVEINFTPVRVYPSMITDTSFIPAEAHVHCVNGYQWASIFQPASTSGEYIIEYINSNIILLQGS